MRVPACPWRPESLRRGSTHSGPVYVCGGEGQEGEYWEAAPVAECYILIQGLAESSPLVTWEPAALHPVLGPAV